MSGSFIDTNVLVYLLSTDAAKAARARELLDAGGVISVQVLNEVANVLVRKQKLPWAEVHAFMGLVHALLPTVQPLTITTHEKGLEIAERYGLSFYDAVLIAAALEAGCDVLWSEDMQDGLVIQGSLRIINPFA
jgi:predicted nucleic acid-binding protein